MAASKFLFVSYDGLIADIAWEVVKEGAEAELWIKDPDEQGIADGYREDIGDRWSEEDSDRLHSWGYLRE